VTLVGSEAFSNEKCENGENSFWIFVHISVVSSLWSA